MGNGLCGRRDKGEQVGGSGSDLGKGTREGRLLEAQDLCPLLFSHVSPVLGLGVHQPTNNCLLSDNGLDQGQGTGNGEKLMDLRPNL